MNKIWFVSNSHRENFEKLVERFKASRNAEYRAACYICAHPEIHYRVDWENASGPIEWYWGEWIGDDDNGYLIESEKVAYLSSAYRGLVRAAVELYTGRKHYFDLMGFLGNAGDEVYKLFVQMMEIRRERFIIDLNNDRLSLRLPDET